MSESYSGNDRNTTRDITFSNWHNYYVEYSNLIFLYWDIDVNTKRSYSLMPVVFILSKFIFLCVSYMNFVADHIAGHNTKINFIELSEPFS